MSYEIYAFSSPAFEDTGSLYDNTLLCPSCGGNNIHHGRVHVFAREREDSVKGYRVTAGDAGVTVTNDLTVGNPSLRRDGVVIEMWCEGCTTLFELRVAQHKGATYVTSVPTVTLSEEDYATMR